MTSPPHDRAPAAPAPSARARPGGRLQPYDELGRFDILCLDREGLSAFVQEHCGGTPGDGVRVYKQLWQRRVRRFDEMDGIRAVLRERLAEVAFIRRLDADLRLESTDGTVKYLWRLQDGHVVESVYIPDEDRVTLCISSQVGCAMACTFCLTGDLGLKRHLLASEIALQVMQVQADQERRISNIVLMGMGEPLHNLPNLVPALSTCLDDHALNFSHRKVTVSTVGLVSKMAELAAALPVNLAVSLNATTEEQRRQIMPITRRHSMEELLEACRDFPMPPGKRITFEYVMFAGFNDSLDDAARLLELLRGIKAKVNLIPYNDNPERDLHRPSDATVKAFQDFLVTRGMSTSVRTTRGIDISAACGQLGKTRQQVDDGVVPAPGAP
jgi:23S rRNA (adenine2503-C2)-methyltransferase